MKLLSRWAYHHYWLARFLIVLIAIFLTCLAVIAGGISSEEGYRVSPVWTWLISIITLVVFAIYPAKESRAYKLYRVRKSFDLLLATSSFLLVTFTVNQYTPGVSTARQVVTFTSASYAATYLGKPIKPHFRKHKRVAKQWLRALHEKYKQASPTSKALLISLTIVVAAGLLIGLASLACTISCSGSEALAIAVFLVGVTGIILLARLAILRIRFGPKRKPKNDPIPTS